MSGKSNASLAALDKIDPKIIMRFRKTGESEAIPEYLQEYIVQLDKAAEIQNIHRNVTRAAKELQVYFPDLSFQSCRQRIYDAINKFHLNSTVKEEAWLNYYADFMEDIGKAAIAGRNIIAAQKAIEKAAEFRIQASKSSMNPDDIKPNIYIISPNVEAGRFGISEKNLRELWPDTRKFINKLPIDDRDKQSALNDAALVLGEEIDFNMVDDEDEEDME